jgi:high-affinity iron transporter
METALLVMVREGFEAALIVAIVLGYLNRTGHGELRKAVWAGVALAAVLALGFGIVIHATVGQFTGSARLHADAVIAALAVVMLTWMVFWMQRQSRSMKGELEKRIDDAFDNRDVRRAVVAVAFLAVLREGIEASLFLIAAATSDSGKDVLIGGLIGLAIAFVAGIFVYLGGRKMPMRLFFKVTGVIVILFAGGLCAKLVLFEQNAGDIGSFNDALFDLRGFWYLNPGSEVGRFLGGILGWDPRPSVEQVVAWAAYVIPVTYLFLRGARPPKVEATKAPASAAVA